MNSESIGELVVALAKAQANYKPLLKDSLNPFFKSKYSDLSSTIEATREALGAQGLAVIQTTQVTEGRTELVTTIAHSSGQWIAGVYPINPTKTDPQGYGSAMTYARRYAYSAITGIASEDDDGESATRRDKKEPHQTVGNAPSSPKQAAPPPTAPEAPRPPLKHPKTAGEWFEQITEYKKADKLGTIENVKKYQAYASKHKAPAMILANIDSMITMLQDTQGTPEIKPHPSFDGYVRYINNFVTENPTEEKIEKERKELSKRCTGAKDVMAFFESAVATLGL